MRLLARGLGSLAAVFGLALGCGQSEGNANGPDSAHQAGTAGKTAAGGGASAGAPSAGGKGTGGYPNGGTSGQGMGGGRPMAGESHGGAASAAGAPSDGGDASGGGGEPNTSGDLVSCDARQVLCRVATPQCAVGEAASVVGTCWGKCVNIAECACASPDECPLPDQYTCWMKSHCGPFVR